jgi:hypothetical protein
MNTILSVSLTTNGYVVQPDAVHPIVLATSYENSSPMCLT